MKLRGLFGYPASINPIFIDLPWQQLLNIMEGLSFRQFLKYLAKVTVRLQSIQSGGLNQAVKIGAGFGAPDGIGKEPIVAANHKWPDRPFNGIIVCALLRCI